MAAKKAEQKLYLCGGKAPCADNPGCKLHNPAGDCYQTTKYDFSREKELREIFADIEDGTRPVIDTTISDLLFIEAQMLELKGLPFIRVDKKNPAKQQTTPAARLYKELSQAKDSKTKILLTVLNRADSAAADELLKKLSEFE